MADGGHIKELQDQLSELKAEERRLRKAPAYLERIANDEPWVTTVGARLVAIDQAIAYVEAEIGRLSKFEAERHSA